jgi:hypothetical protein
MDESWVIILLLLSWCLSGIVTWWCVMRPINELTLGDALALPLCALLGWVAAFMAIIEFGLFGRAGKIVIWKRRD